MMAPQPQPSYAQVDRETKTAAIKAARAGLVGIEALIEQAINAEPARFSPKEAKEVRTRYANLADKLEDVIHMLSIERDEFEQLNFQVTKMKTDIEYANKQLLEAQDQRAHWFSKYEKLRRLMENEGMKFDEGD